MDSDMSSFFDSIETENNSLTELVTNLETDVTRLNTQVSDLEKALAKQKKFHRKYAEDVVSAENCRIADFKEEKRTLVEENKSLLKSNRQLSKDLDFYKKGFEELMKENGGTGSAISNRTETKSTATSSALSPVATSITKAECSHKSSKVLSKISEKAMLENKRLKSKIEMLNATIRAFKTKNQKLENFKKKVDNKKLKFSQDTDEIALLVESTEQTNEKIFTPEMLAMLDNLSKYEIPSNSE